MFGWLERLATASRSSNYHYPEHGAVWTRTPRSIANCAKEFFPCVGVVPMP
jgi:hypothetical protein